ncbi:MAG: ankyrin repeat domain-containing protein [Treponema sp.]|nr:ankyrin repeat domain-containing protein [Treponema sp.]
MKHWVALLFLVSLLPASAFSQTSGKNIGEHALFSVVERGPAKEVRKLLNVSRALPVRQNNETLLMAAVKANRDIDVVSALIEADSTMTATTTDGITALMFACQYESHEKVIKAIIANSAFFSSGKKNYILTKDNKGQTAFDYALKNTAPEKITQLLKKYTKFIPETQASAAKAALTTKEPAAQSAPENAAEAEPASEAAPENAAQPAPPAPEQEAEESVKAEAEAHKPASEESETQLKAEAQEEKTPSKRAETASDAAPQKKMEENYTQPDSQPVQSAIEPYKPTYLFDYAKLESTDDIPPETPVSDSRFRHTFIQNPDARDSEGRTLLMKAVRDGNEELIDNLLYSEADIQLTDNDGWTALMFAARFQSNPLIIRRLIFLGANVSQTNNYGLSALALAAGLSDTPDVVAALLENRSAAEKDVRASFIYAVTMEAATDILSLFTEKGISLNAPYGGKTPLMYAAENNTNTNVIAWLLRRGAKTTYKTSDGKTAFDFAQANPRLPHNENYWALLPPTGGN